MPSPLRITGPEPGFDSRVEEVVRRVLRAELGRLAGRAAAEASAQERGQGLGIENIRRGVGYATIGPFGSAINLPAAVGNANPIPGHPLTVDVVLSGRPVVVEVQGILQAGASGSARLGVTMRGRIISGDGTVGTYVDDSVGPHGVHGFEFVAAPDPGPARFEVTYGAIVAQGALHVHFDTCRILVREL